MHPSREVPHQHGQMGIVNRLRHLQMWGEADYEPSPVLSRLNSPVTANDHSAANDAAILCAAILCVRTTGGTP